MSHEAFNLLLAKMFRYGVYTAGVFLLLGWVSSIQWSENIFIEFQTYNEQPLTEALDYAWTHHHWGVLSSYLGIALLICLPFLRVMISAYLFSKRKERYMFTLSLLVLSGLVLSLFIGALK